MYIRVQCTKTGILWRDDWSCRPGSYDVSLMSPSMVSQVSRQWIASISSFPPLYRKLIVDLISSWQDCVRTVQWCVPKNCREFPLPVYRREGRGKEHFQTSSLPQHTRSSYRQRLHRSGGRLQQWWGDTSVKINLSAWWGGGACINVCYHAHMWMSCSWERVRSGLMWLQLWILHLDTNSFSNNVATFYRRCVCIAAFVMTVNFL